MKQVSTLFDALRNEKFAIAVKDGLSIRYYGAEGAGREWAQWANSVDTKSLETSHLPAGIIQGPFKTTNEIGLKSIINSLGYAQDSASFVFSSKSYSFKNSYLMPNGSRVPAVMDTPISHFTSQQYLSTINYKALTMRTEIKEGSFLFEARANDYAFNFDTYMYNAKPSKAEIKSLRQRIDNNLGRSSERRLGLKLKAAILQTSNREKIGVAYGLETKSLNESIEQKGIGQRIGGAGRIGRRAARSAAFFDPNAWDGDGDGIVQEGTPFQRPAIPGVNDRSTGGKVDVEKATAAWEKAGTGKRGKVSKRTVLSSPAQKPQRGLASTRKKPWEMTWKEEIDDAITEALKGNRSTEEIENLAYVGLEAGEISRAQESAITEAVNKFNWGLYEDKEDFMSEIMNIIDNDDDYAENAIERIGKDIDNMPDGQEYSRRRGLASTRKEPENKKLKKEFDNAITETLKGNQDTEEILNLAYVATATGELSKAQESAIIEAANKYDWGLYEDKEDFMSEIMNIIDNDDSYADEVVKNIGKEIDSMSEQEVNRRRGLASRSGRRGILGPRKGDSSIKDVDLSPGNLDNKSWKQVGGQGGSQPGAEFEDPSGEKFYVKKQKSKLHAENEVLMSKLYEVLGVKAARNSGGTAHIPGHSSGPGVFSRWIKGSKSVNHAQEMRNPAWKKSVQDTFVANAWLANWDSTGNPSNIKMGPDGKAYIVDTGGGGFFRAQGAAKGSAFGPIVGEMESLRNPGLNPLGADYFSDVPAQEIAKQVAAIGALSDDDIKKIVDGIITDKAEAKKMSDTLIARRDYLVANWGTGKKGGGSGKVPAGNSGSTSPGSTTKTPAPSAPSAPTPTSTTTPGDAGAAKPAKQKDGTRTRVKKARTQRQVDGIVAKKSKAKKKSKFKAIPGRDRVEDTDGQLWESLTPEQKIAVEKNAKQAYQDLMDSIKTSNSDWWDSFISKTRRDKKRFTIDTDGDEWSKDSRLAGEALTSLSLAVEDASKDVKREISVLENSLSRITDPDEKLKVQKKIDKLNRDFGRLQKSLDDLRTFDQMEKTGNWTLLEHLHPETRAKAFGKKIPKNDAEKYTDVFGKTKPPMPLDSPSSIFEEVGGARKAKSRIGEKGDARLAEFARKITRPNPERAERRRLRKAGRGTAVIDREEASDKASPLKRRIRRAKNQFLLQVKGKRNPEDIQSKVDSALKKNAHAFKKQDGSIVIDDAAIDALAIMTEAFKIKKKKGAKGEAVVTNARARKSLVGLWNGNSFNATPTWIRKDEIPQMIAEGWIPIKRGFNREEFADIWLNSPKRHVPGQGNAVVGAGEYWSYVEGGWDIYVTGKDGVIGMVKADRIIKNSRIEAMRKDHSIISQAVDVYIKGPGSGGRWDSELNAQELAQEIEETIKKMIPADSGTWNTEWGQVYKGVFQWMKTVNPKDTENNKKAVEVLKLLNRLGDSDSTIHAGFLGYDGVDFGFGDGRVVMHNRSAMLAVNEPMTLDEIKEAAKGGE